MSWPSSVVALRLRVFREPCVEPSKLYDPSLIDPKGSQDAFRFRRGPPLSWNFGLRRVLGCDSQLLGSGLTVELAWPTASQVFTLQGPFPTSFQEGIQRGDSLLGCVCHAVCLSLSLSHSLFLSLSFPRPFSLSLSLSLPLSLSVSLSLSLSLLPAPSLVLSAPLSTTQHAHIVSAVVGSLRMFSVSFWGATDNHFPGQMSQRPMTFQGTVACPGRFIYFNFTGLMLQGFYFRTFSCLFRNLNLV